MVNDIFFGCCDCKMIEVFFCVNYIFDVNMILSFCLCYYWLVVLYNSFYFLEVDGLLGIIDYDGDYDNDFDVFNIDFVYCWCFVLGLDIFIVWKNSIFSLYEVVLCDYFCNLDGFF